jgi:rhodanese-related sulfurtransferase
VFDFMRKPSFQIGLVIFAALIVVVIALSGQQRSVSQTPINTLTVPEPTTTIVPNVISVGTAHDLYMSNSAYFLDVRERSEWDEFHIPNTTLLPLSQVAALVDKLPRDKPIIAISGSDNRAQQARDIIKQSGFGNVTSMAGGIVSWRTQGYPIEP